VQVKKIKALQQEIAPNILHKQNGNPKGQENHILNPNLSTKDKENIKNLHSMMGE